MARNRITGRETQKMQEYTQGQISQAERRGIEFPTDVKEQLFEYANLIGEEEKVRTLVRNLADAVIQADEEGVEDLLDDARMDIQDLPDPTIGKLELRDYGYTAEDMVPLRKEAALDYHRMGSKIYCLGSDGSKGEYASKEMIQAHEGLFGMESQMWERIEENDLDYADEDFGAFQEPMSVIEQEEALKLYDAGADIYLITNFSSPMYVTERMEIERGPEHYQMSMTELERFRNLEWEMQKYPQIQSLKEANLLLGTRRTFGIYQIKDDSPGENYAFMNMSFIESHGMQIKKEDYKQIIKVCEPGIEATPDALEFYYYLAVAYNQAEKPDSVISICKRALEHTTADSKKEIVSDFYSILGDMYHTQKQMKEAYAAYDSALVYNPSNIGALNNYAYYLSVERRDLDKAEEMSYKTVKAEPNNATYLDTYAWILFEKGNYAEARIYIDNAMKSEGGDKSDVIVEHCGDIYYMTGDVDGALTYWKKALEMGSESKTLKQKIEKKKYIAE